MNSKTNKKIKLSAMFLLSAIMLSGFFMVPAQTFAATCDSATLTGNVFVNDAPARARFIYSADYNTVVNGRGTGTPTQTFYSNGHIGQLISNLSGNTVYYYKLEVTSPYGTTVTNIKNFKTSQCAVPNVPNAPEKYPTVVLYANKESVSPNGAATVRWIATDATFCSAYGGSPGWEGTRNAKAGSFYAAPLSSSATFLITCGNSLGVATDSVRVAVRREVLKKQTTPKVISQNWTDKPIWSDPINTVIAPKATALEANALGAGFLPTNLFGWLFSIILLLILVFLVRHALE